MESLSMTVLALLSCALLQGERVNRPLAERPIQSDVADLSLAPTGQHAYYTAGGERYRVPTAGGLSTPTAAGVEARFTPDGAHSLVVTFLGGNSLQLHATRTDGSAGTRLLGERTSLLTYSISPDSCHVVLDAPVASVPMDGSRGELDLGLPLSALAAITPDSSQVVALHSRSIYRVPIDGSTAPVVLHNFPAPWLAHGAPIVTPDSARVLVTLRSNSLYQLWSVRVDGSAAPVLLAELGFQPRMQLSPDSLHVGYVDFTSNRDPLYSVPVDGGHPPLLISAASADVEEFAFTGDGQWVVYLDTSSSLHAELFSTRTDGSAAARKLNGVLPFGGNVTGFVLPPSGASVAYRADQEIDQRFELFSVDVAGGAASVKISGTNPPHADVADFKADPAGAGVLFRIDRDADEAYQLFAAGFAGTEPPLELSGPRVAGGSVQPGWGFGSAAGRVVFVADARTDEHFELFSASASEGRILLSERARGSVEQFLTTPGAERALYLADGTTPGRREAYSVAIDGPNLAARLNPEGTEVERMALLPDASRALLLTAGSGEVLSVPIDGSEPPVILTPDGIAYSIEAPDSENALFLFHRTGAAKRGLYSAPVLGGPLRKLNPGLTTGFFLSDDYVVAGPRAVFEIYQNGGSSNLWSATIAPGQNPVQLGTSPAWLSRFRRFAATPDGTRVAYVADRDADEVYELYSVPTDHSLPTLKISAPLVSGGDVNADLALTPDSRHVVYSADATTDGVVEHFSAALDGSSPAVFLALTGTQAVQRASATHAVLLGAALGTADELTSVPLDGSAAPSRLHAPLAPGSSIAADFELTPDGSFVVFRLRGAGQGPMLLCAPVDASAPPLVLEDQREVADFVLSPDGNTIAYRARTGSEPHALYVVPRGGGLAQRASAELVPGGALYTGGPGQPRGHSFSSDGRRLLYLADQEQDGVRELFFTQLARPLWRRR